MNEFWCWWFNIPCARQSPSQSLIILHQTCCTISNFSNSQRQYKAGPHTHTHTEIGINLCACVYVRYMCVFVSAHKESFPVFPTHLCWQRTLSSPFPAFVSPFWYWNIEATCAQCAMRCMRCSFLRFHVCEGAGRGTLKCLSSNSLCVFVCVCAGALENEHKTKFMCNFLITNANYNVSVCLSLDSGSGESLRT